MKTLVIDTNCNIKEVDFVYENFSELYKKCGYRSCNNYVCIESVDIEGRTLEFWGKKSKSGYEYFKLILYGKCCIVLKNANGIQELTIEEYNKNILKYLEGDCNDNSNDNRIDNDIDNGNNGNDSDNNKVNNPEDEEQYEDCEDECEDEIVDDEHGDKVDDDVPDDDGDNQEDDNGDIHDKECLDVDEADEEDISENENYADEEDNLGDTNIDKKKSSKNIKKSKNSKNSKNIANNTNETYFNIKVGLDNSMVNKNKIDIDELVSNELVAEEYIYTSDEDY